MKKMIVLVFVLFFSVSSSSVFAENGDSLKINFNTGIVSQWLGEPGGIVVYNRPAWRNEIDISYGKYYGGVWTSVGLNDRGIRHKNDFGDEVDFFLGLHQLYRFLEIDLSAKYFALNNLRDSGDDALIFDGQFDFPTKLSPYLAVRYWGEVGSKSLERGWFFRPGIKRSFPILKKASLNLDTSITFSDGPIGKDPGFICGVIKISSDIKIGEKVSLSPFLVFQLPSSSQNGGTKDFTGKKDKEVMFGVNVSF